jgi:hypothetical protein
VGFRGGTTKQQGYRKSYRVSGIIMRRYDEATGKVTGKVTEELL